MTNLERALMAAADGQKAPDPVRELVAQELRAPDHPNEHDDNASPALNSPHIEVLLRAGLTDTQEKN
ncbi:hypothetical protein [uncultured Serinicoccus sp.]|uniref:hypothetical protein n=1 Tax=uncultured Serinicoccus sp. TaxID=735514 RepID=UPI00262D5993|nr:hypothetical protein [uncultured Serinicoccus sp.]